MVITRILHYFILFFNILIAFNKFIDREFFKINSAAAIIDVIQSPLICFNTFRPI
jgi:hypothetical protein